MINEREQYYRLLKTPTIAVLILVAFFIFDDENFANLYDVFKYPPYFFSTFEEGGYPYLVSALVKSWYICFTALIIVIQLRKWNVIKSKCLHFFINVLKKMRYVWLIVSFILALAAGICFYQYQYPRQQEDWVAKTVSMEEYSSPHESLNDSVWSYSETVGDETSVYYVYSELLYEYFDFDAKTQEGTLYAYKEDMSVHAAKPYGDYAYLRGFIILTFAFYVLSQMASLGFAAARMK